MINFKRVYCALKFVHHGLPFFFHRSAVISFPFQNVVFRPRLNIVIFLPILGYKYSCMIPRLRIYGGITKQFCRVFRIVGNFAVQRKEQVFFYC